MRKYISLLGIRAVMSVREGETAIKIKAAFWRGGFGTGPHDNISGNLQIALIEFLSSSRRLRVGQAGEIVGVACLQKEIAPKSFDFLIADQLYEVRYETSVIKSLNLLGLRIGSLKFSLALGHNCSRPMQAQNKINTFLVAPSTVEWRK